MDIDIIEQFEYPLPILKTDVDKLVIETSSSYKGSFTIQNAGGGMLSGHIMSNSSFIKFTPEQFEGNKLKVQFEMDLDIYKFGDMIRTDAIVMSNGGECNIPVIIKVIYPAIITREDFKIASLKDYMSYAKKYPTQARQLFTSNEFIKWLIRTEFEYMDVYDYLAKDPKKERALENFFILCKLKKSATISVEESTISHEIMPNQNNIISDSFAVKKSGWGYISKEIKTKYPTAWLKLFTEQINTSDFHLSDTVDIAYTVNTALIESSRVTNKILISDDIGIDVIVKRKPYLTVEMSKEFYDFEDQGTLTITNNSGKDVTISIMTKDNYVRFEGKNYIIGEYADIPFHIKVTAIQKAQMGFKRQPSVSTEITIRAVVDGTVIQKHLDIIMADYSSE